jgi:hypothetical protein
MEKSDEKVSFGKRAMEICVMENRFCNDIATIFLLKLHQN